MRVAFVNHLPNHGGLTRFTHALLAAVVTANRSVEVDYFVSTRLLELGRVPQFANDRVRTIPLSDPRVDDDPLESRAPALVVKASQSLRAHPWLFDVARNAYRAPGVVRRAVIREPEMQRWFHFSLNRAVDGNFSGYDVVYLPFPYYLEPADIAAPVVATFHDFNHRYFGNQYGRTVLKALERQLAFWTNRAEVPAVSTKFVRSDLARFYPDAGRRAQVIYVAPYSYESPSADEIAHALSQLRVSPGQYVLYPANDSVHKNVQALVRAADVLRRSGGPLRHPIVLTGFGTDRLGTGTSSSWRAVDDFLSTSPLVIGQDIRPLGYVSDLEVDALTRSAALVVSCSLYEAGCGPALDAWQFGVPVAFSRIPPFVEQLDALGVEAWLFDPHDPEDIAAVLATALGDANLSLGMAQRSQQAIGRYTWQTAADNYLHAFSRAQELYRATAPRPT